MRLCIRAHGRVALRASELKAARPARCKVSFKVHAKMRSLTTVRQRARAHTRHSTVAYLLLITVNVSTLTPPLTSILFHSSSPGASLFSTSCTSPPGPMHVLGPMAPLSVPASRTSISQRFFCTENTPTLAVAGRGQNEVHCQTLHLAGCISQHQNPSPTRVPAAELFSPTSCQVACPPRRASWRLRRTRLHPSRARPPRPQSPVACPYGPAGSG